MNLSNISKSKFLTSHFLNLYFNSKNKYKAALFYYGPLVYGVVYMGASLEVGNLAAHKATPKFERAIDIGQKSELNAPLVAYKATHTLKSESPYWEPHLYKFILNKN